MQGGLFMDVTAGAVLGPAVAECVAVPTTATANLRTVSGALITALYSYDVWDTTLPHVEVYGTWPRWPPGVASRR
jgi:hypothetical protein